MACSRFCTEWRVSISVIALSIVGALAGCRGDGVDAVPVSGQITVDGEPLRSKAGMVNLVPNKEKGNNTALQPSGPVDENGNYTIYYDTGKKGAPPGWYRVQVSAMPQGDQPLPTMGPRRIGKGSPPSVPRLFNLKYASAKDSGLEIEVVRDPAPGAYNLKLSK